MRVFFVTLAVVCFSTSMLAQEGRQKAESKTRLMVSFTDLKWVELPERKGMQFAVPCFQETLKSARTRRFAKSLPVLTTRYTPTAAKSKT